MSETPCQQLATTTPDGVEPHRPSLTRAGAMAPRPATFPGLLPGCTATFAQAPRAAAIWAYLYILQPSKHAVPDQPTPAGAQRPQAPVVSTAGAAEKPATARRATATATSDLQRSVVTLPAGQGTAWSPDSR